MRLPSLTHGVSKLRPSTDVGGATAADSSVFLSAAAASTAVWKKSAHLAAGKCTSVVALGSYEMAVDVTDAALEIGFAAAVLLTAHHRCTFPLAKDG